MVEKSPRIISHSDSMHIQMQSEPAQIAPVRKAVEEFAAERGFNEADIGEIGLCVNEAIANVIRHAYFEKPDQPIDLNVDYQNGALTIRIRDWGSGVTPDINREKTQLFKPGGLGLPCLKSMMDEVQFVAQPDGMLLELVKRRT